MNPNICPLCGFYPLESGGEYAHCSCCDSSFLVSSLSQKKREKDTSFLDSLRKSVFELNGSSDDVEKRGTAFAIDKKLLLTCAHVVSDGMEENGSFRYLNYSISVCMDESSFVNAKILKIDKELDLAVLKIEGRRSFEPLRLDLKKQNSGAHVFAIGNGKGNGISTVDGVISDFYRKVNGRSLLLFSAPVITGYSGGPLVNEHGLVVGVITGGELGETTMNYAIPMDVVQKFIEDI